MVCRGRGGEAKFWRDGRVADKTASGCRRTPARGDGGPEGVRDVVPNNRAPRHGPQDHWSDEHSFGEMAEWLKALPC